MATNIGGLVLKVLVVDDEEMILSIATKILERQSYEVITAWSGEEGIRQCFEQSDQIDLMLLDLTMPGLSGIETLRRVRQTCPDLPCIISSGHNADWDNIPEDLKANVRFLQKPYRADKLTELVNSILAKETT